MPSKIGRRSYCTPSSLALVVPEVSGYIIKLSVVYRSDQLVDFVDDYDPFGFDLTLNEVVDVYAAKELICVTKESAKISLTPRACTS